MANTQFQPFFEDRMIFITPHEDFGSSFCQIAGAVLIIIGAVVYFSEKNLDSYWSKDAHFQLLPQYIIAVGVFFLAIAAFGHIVCCCFNENCIVLSIYIVLVGVLLAITIAISASMLNVDAEGSNNLRVTMRNHQSTYKINATSKNYWDDFQKNYICCGIDNRTDWLEFMPEPPESCCQDTYDPHPHYAKTKEREEDPYCLANDSRKPYLQFKGCFAKIRKTQQNYRLTLIIIISIASGAQATCFVLAIVMIVLRD